MIYKIISKRSYLAKGILFDNTHKYSHKYCLTSDLFWRKNILSFLLTHQLQASEQARSFAGKTSSCFHSEIYYSSWNWNNARQAVLWLSQLHLPARGGDSTWLNEFEFRAFFVIAGTFSKRISRNEEKII